MLALVLALATIAVYAQVWTFDFAVFDDPQYVRNNPRVSGGLSGAALRWAFTATYAANWHPLTWLSHMLDCQLFGLSAGAHHLVNVMFHAAATVALFFVLADCTRERWPSAFVAAAFALHPLHVESVAWIAERKDVLSAFCWMLTLGVYAQYGRGRGALWWWASLVTLAAGLMAKPMVVTAPVTLLLVDIWPLGRICLDDLVAAPSRLWPLVREKLPHAGLAVVAAVITVLAQSREGAVAPLTDVSFLARLSTVPVSYVSYLFSALWPTGLAFFYPRSVASPIVAFGATVLLIAVSALVWRYRSRPYLAVGWAWYLVTLFPVSGIVQAGDQLMADRFTYVPLIGIFVAVAWAGRDLARSGNTAQLAVTIAGCAALTLWTILTFAQIGTWRNSIALARHALAVTRNNHVAHNVLGTAYLETGRLDEAMTEFRAGVAITPGYAPLQSGLGQALARRGDATGAATAFQQALRLRPDPWNAFNLGQALASLGDNAGAAEAYRTALRLGPPDAALHIELGLALGKLGRYDEALAEYRAALAIEPRRASAYNNIGMTLEATGAKDEAIESYRAALRIEPTNTFALTNLGATLGDQGQWDESARYLEEAIRLGASTPESQYLLGVTRLGQGRREEAAAAFERALSLRPGWPIAQAKLQMARQGEQPTH